MQNEEGRMQNGQRPELRDRELYDGPPCIRKPIGQRMLASVREV